MASGICVTSFRTFLRRTDLRQFGRRGFRLTPVATFTLTARHKSSEANDSKPKKKQENDCSAGTTPNAAHADLELEQMRVAELKAMLRERELPVTGKKELLIKRLSNYAERQAALQPPTTTEPVSMRIALEEGYPEEETQTNDKPAELKSAHKSMQHKSAKAFDGIGADAGGSSVDAGVGKIVADTTAAAAEQPVEWSSHKASIMQNNLSQIEAKEENAAIVAAETLTAKSNRIEGSNYNRTTRKTTKRTTKDKQIVNHEAVPTTEAPQQHKPSNNDATVAYVQGIPHLTIPLPSRNERCVFTLKPISHNVGDLIDMLKIEDRGIDRVTIVNKDSVRIASTCSIESLMDEQFWIQINDKKYEVNPPKREKIDLDHMDKIGDVKKVIAQLYEAFNVAEYQTQKSTELVKQLEEVQFQLQPLEQKKTQLNAQAARKTNIMTWVGLGLMSMQFGILARLTWWEYSWDIMEPVTYFVTYGTTMAMYAYYCITKQEYVMEQVKNREFILNIYKNAKKQNFDIDQYNMLKRRAAEIEYDLNRLKDPLNMQLPAHISRLQLNPPKMSQLDANAVGNSASSSDDSSSSSKGSSLDTSTKLKNILTKLRLPTADTKKTE